MALGTGEDAVTFLLLWGQTALGARIVVVGRVVMGAAAATFYQAGATLAGELNEEGRGLKHTLQTRVGLVHVVYDQRSSITTAQFPSLREPAEMLS